MDNNMFQRLKDLVTQHQTIGILVGPNPSLDQMGAALGMYLALKQMGKIVTVASPTPATVGVSSLVGIDKVTMTLGGSAAPAPQVMPTTGGDMVVTFPYREGEIEKVSYNTDPDKQVLNIVVQPGVNGFSFGPQDVRVNYGGNQQAAPAVAAPSGPLPTLIFFIGIANPQTVASIVTPEGIRAAGVTVVNIDNKTENQNYGDVVHVSSKFSSVSEEVADFLTLLEPQIELDVDTSQNLLSGILSATNNFQGGQGSYLAFEMAGILMKKGAVRKDAGVTSPQPQATVDVNNFFPPQMAPVQQPVQNQMPQQPVFNPGFQPQPINQPFQQTFGQSQVPSQPMAQQPFNQPMQPIQNPVNQPTQQQPAQQNQQPPADWLTPKVYKGSTVI